MKDIKLSPLGKNVFYEDVYNPKLLFPILRSVQRSKIGIHEDNLPFKGVDIWNAYEISWLNERNKPKVAIGTFYFPCESKFIIESKSLKLYLNSFNNTKFKSTNTVIQTIKNDLSTIACADVCVALQDVNSPLSSIPFKGQCIDHLDVSYNQKHKDVNVSYLGLDELSFSVNEYLYTNLFRSNCPITNQPDWATLFIHYKGYKIDHSGLLKYIISFRNHNEFHEHCAERIYQDIKQKCNPDYLSVYARYTRRGGIDICPYRSTTMDTYPPNLRTARQ